jgi:uncharacterized protein (TIGR03086 family)
MDDLEAISCATDEFRRWLAAVQTDQWQSQSPCGEWDVTALVGHVVGGNRMAELLLHGATASASLEGAKSAPGADLPAGFDLTGADQIAAFAEAGALERTCHHVVMDMPGSTLLMFRTTDLALHGWDLATSIGADPTIHPDLAASIWTRLEPLASLLAGSGMFGTPHGEVADDDSPMAKLLHATGR